jgi:cytidylate kinase
MKELNDRGGVFAFEDVLAEIRSRDARDIGRTAAPLVAANDAVVIDTSGMEIDEAVEAAIGVADRARS